MNAGIRGRLQRAMTAHGLSQAVTILIQLVGVPLLLACWGIQLYGEWLLLSAFSAYLSLADVGLCSVVANEMTMRVADGDEQSAIELYQSTWVLLSAITVVAGLATVSILPALPVGHWLSLEKLPDASADAILVALGLATLLKLQLGVLSAGYRCSGHYAEAQLFSAVLRLLEFAAISLIAVGGGGPTAAAFAMLALTLALGVLFWWRLRVIAGWLELGVRHARLARIQRLIRPALAYFGFPVGTALSLQGMVHLIGASLGAAAVVTFSTTRTLTRLAFQVLNIVVYSFQPEISMAFGAGDLPLARHLHRQACRISLWTVVPVLVALQVAGPTIVRVWTRGRVTCDPVLLALLLAVVLANTLWYASSVVPQATNRHERLAWRYLIASALAVGVAWLIVPWLGVPGAALSLFAIDALMFGVVLQQSLPLVEDGLRPFARALAKPIWVR